VEDIAIIGAGELGGALADALARLDIAAGIRLIDEAGRVAEGKALDIMQSAPIEGFSTDVSGSSDLAAAGGAALVVIADRVRGAEWQGEDGLLLLKRLTPFAGRSPILCAGASQRELVDRGVRELHIARERLFGSAPEALAGGARALVALTLDGSPRDVALSVLGLPPAQIVIPWEEATFAGFALTKLIDQPARRRAAARIAALWPPGPYALAAASAKAAATMFGRSRMIVSCFVAPDDAAGIRKRTTALPARLNRRGIERVVCPELSGADRVALDSAMLL
jgi:malate dehydrogenase